MFIYLISYDKLVGHGAVADLTNHYDLVEQIVHGNGVTGYSDVEAKAWVIIEELLERDNEQIKLKARN